MEAIMKRKTYAFFDLVGTKQAFEDGTADKLLGEFWMAADAWATTFNPGNLPLEGEHAVQAPRVVVRTFSDSALLSTREEHTLDAFYAIAFALKQQIEKRTGSLCYCIVNRDNEVAHHDLPATGGIAFDSDRLVAAYENIGGSGAAWVNLLYADGAIAKAKHWHGKFTQYCVGKQSIPPGREPKDSLQFPGFGKVTAELLALG